MGFSENSPKLDPNRQHLWKKLKHTYSQYRIFGKNRAALPEFVKELHNKDYQKHVRDYPDLKKCLRIARQWETGAVPQPDDMELP
ncbi:hypothetical protein GCK72_022438 [Caenorhabditis remanei]|uniref:Uncharacterized protein n=1 Tax=Caenorhabditis remanei TaxID=31234 RepID=A0A6A5FTR1_CAERE|nr:hypothetical protein GCK72_022438 [Caenorhabditis remanei]KAF1745988.1 hypothetical protein GCK72_022438 [Caenorhabditis remanei]